MKLKFKGPNSNEVQADVFGCTLILRAICSAKAISQSSISKDYPQWFENKSYAQMFDHAECERENHKQWQEFT